MKLTKNKKLIFLLASITMLFMFIILYLVYFEMFLSEDLNKNVLNPRNSVDETKIKRGSIFDINGVELVSSKLLTDNYIRTNRYDYLYSNIIGYSSEKYGKTGIELFYNNELLNITRNSDIFDKFENIYKKENGANINLTIDDDIQSYAYDLLGNNKGVILVSKPDTGEIVSMVSKPSYNVNEIENEWDNIISSENGELLNRATQGLYEPGSVFKIVTSIAFLRSGIDLNYSDTGKATISNNTVNNLENHVYGEMGLEKALNVSANTYFFEKSKEVSNSMFIKTLEDFGVNANYSFPIVKYKSILPFKEGLSDLEKAYASFGQGKTYMSPLDMLLIGMGIANDGVVMQPKIIDKIYNEGTIKNVENKVLSNKIESNFAKQIREYLKSTAEYNDIYLKNNISIAGKTGSAETAGGKNHLWYLSMAPADKPKYVVLVLLESTEGTASENAVPKAVDILNFIFNR